MSKVLVVSTSKNTRGGITSVVNAHTKMEYWKKWDCEWIETHIDRGIIEKVNYAIRAYAKYIKKIPHAELVHIHFSNQISALRKYPFFLTAKIFGKKVITHFHAFSSEDSYGGKYKQIYKDIFRRSDTVIVLSKFWADEVKSVCNEAKTKIVYNPILNNVVGEYEKKENSVLFAGTLNKRKGYDVLIKGFSRISKEYDNWHLIFAGNGEIEKAEEIAEKYSVKDKIRFLGWIEGKEKEKIFKTSSVFCLPSYAEGFPMAVLDAISYKLPVITTPVGGITDIFTDNVDLMLFSPGNDHDLSEKLRRIIADEEYRKIISENGYKKVIKLFSPEIISEVMDKLYNTIIKR
jgi:glycosyltransferase involved in cell wall biosynthesis